MKILVTGSSGHLGEGLVRVLRDTAHEVVSLDRLPSPFTTHVGSLTDRAHVRQCMKGVDAVLHAATLHKPHVATHTRQQFIDTNITGTLHLLEEATTAGVSAFVFTSTTSTFGRALIPPPGAPAAWITEDVRPVPKNIYGVTKIAAEDLCELFHHLHALPCLVLRTSRFFPEPDDDPTARAARPDLNLKANEYLHRRIDLQDVVDAHLLALHKAPQLGFQRLILSATTPFQPADLPELRTDAPAVLRRLHPTYEPEYTRRGWTLPPEIDRVYVNTRARLALDWHPRYNFPHILESLRTNEDFQSPLARQVGSKGYHARTFDSGPYPVT